MAPDIICGGGEVEGLGDPTRSTVRLLTHGIVDLVWRLDVFFGVIKEEFLVWFACGGFDLVF